MTNVLKFLLFLIVTVLHNLHDLKKPILCFVIVIFTIYKCSNRLDRLYVCVFQK